MVYSRPFCSALDYLQGDIMLGGVVTQVHDFHPLCPSTPVITRKTRKPPPPLHPLCRNLGGVVGQVLYFFALFFTPSFVLVLDIENCPLQPT